MLWRDQSGVETGNRHATVGRRYGNRFPGAAGDAGAVGASPFEFSAVGGVRPRHHQSMRPCAMPASEPALKNAEMLAMVVTNCRTTVHQNAIPDRELPSFLPRWLDKANFVPWKSLAY